MSYPQGATVRIRGRFRDNLTGLPTDPLNLKLYVEHEGTVTTYAYPGPVVRVKQGEFYCLVPLPEYPVYHYRWQGNDLATPDYLMNVEKSHILELVA